MKIVFLKKKDKNNERQNLKGWQFCDKFLDFTLIDIGLMLLACPKACMLFPMQIEIENLDGGTHKVGRFMLNLELTLVCLH